MSYSIDLGIHPDATGGHDGTTDQDPYPMQIALTQGILVPERGTGPYTGFTPVALASLDQIKAGDIIIFRVFETKSICSDQGRSLRVVSRLQATFTELDGSKALKPWKRNEADVPFSRSSTGQRSLAFTSVPGGMELPCFFQRDSSDGIVTYKIMPPNTTDPVPFLFSVVVETTLAGTDITGTFYHRDDPEMVVSPDEDPCCEGEDRALDQFAETAATSR